MNNITKKFKYTQKGVTLVALIITIIILLLLAGITISMLMNNGIIDKSKIAKENYTNSQNIEENELAKTSEWINSYDKNNTENKPLTADLFSFTPENSNWNVENVQEALDFLYNN